MEQQQQQQQRSRKQERSRSRHRPRSRSPQDRKHDHNKVNKSCGGSTANNAPSKAIKTNKIKLLVETMIIKPKKTTKPEKTKRTKTMKKATKDLRFNMKINQTHPVLSLNEYSNVEKEQCWYTAEDEDAMRIRRDKMIERYELQHSIRHRFRRSQKQQRTTFRGLECWTEKGLEEFQDNVYQCVGTVVREQQIIRIRQQNENRAAGETKIQSGDLNGNDESKGLPEHCHKRKTSGKRHSLPSSATNRESTHSHHSIMSTTLAELSQSLSSKSRRRAREFGLRDAEEAKLAWAVSWTDNSTGGSGENSFGRGAASEDTDDESVGGMTKVTTSTSGKKRRRKSTTTGSTSKTKNRITAKRNPQVCSRTGGSITTTSVSKGNRKNKTVVERKANKTKEKKKTAMKWRNIPSPSSTTPRMKVSLLQYSSSPVATNSSPRRKTGDTTTMVGTTSSVSGTESTRTARSCCSSVSTRSGSTGRSVSSGGKRHHHREQTPSSPTTQKRQQTLYRPPSCPNRYNPVVNPKVGSPPSTPTWNLHPRDRSSSPRARAVKVVTPVDQHSVAKNVRKHHDTEKGGRRERPTTSSTTGTVYSKKKLSSPSSSSSHHRRLKRERTLFHCCMDVTHHGRQEVARKRH